MSPIGARHAFLIACAIAALPAVIGLASPSDLDLQDQARQALYVVDALDGHWLAPRDPERITTKPPLYTWLAAAAATPLGLGELVVRLPSLLASFGLGVVTFLLGRALLGTSEALIGVALLAGLESTVKLANLARTDMLLAFWVALAMLAFVRGRRWTFWLVVGLGALTKGPVGLAVPPLAVALDAAFRSDASRLRALRPELGLPLALALFGAWFVAALRSQPELWDVLVRMELMDRMSGSGRFTEPPQPFWHLLTYLVLRLLPASLVLPLALVRGASSAGREARSLLWSWLIVGVLVVSLPATKRPDHLYPVYPAAMLLSASVLGHWARAAGRTAWERTVGAGLLVWCVSVGLAAFGIAAALASGLRPDLPRPALWALVAGAAAALPVAVAVSRRSDRPLRLGCALTAHILLVGLYAQVFSAAAEEGSAPQVRRFAEQTALTIGDEPLLFHGVGVHSVKFFLDRDTKDVGRDTVRRLAAGPEPHWLVTSASAKAALEADGVFAELVVPEVVARTGTLGRGSELLLLRLRADAAPAAP